MGPLQVPILIPYGPAGIVGPMAMYGPVTGSVLLRTTDSRLISISKGTLRKPWSIRTGSLYSVAKIARSHTEPVERM